jgi:hypothetical protein
MNIPHRIKAILWGSGSILVGAAVIFVGDNLLGIRLELFKGIAATFGDWRWLVDLTIIPLIGGVIVTSIYGLGGKILCMIAALLARVFSYWEISHITGIPDGYSLLPLGFWGFPVIVTMELAMAGGFLGEIFIKKIYGRRPKHVRYLNKETTDNSSVTPPGSE